MRRNFDRNHLRAKWQMIERPPTKYKAASGHSRLPAIRARDDPPSTQQAPLATNRAAAGAGMRRASKRVASADGAGRPDQAPVKNATAAPNVQQAPINPTQ